MDKEISQIILNAINEIAEEKQIAKEDIIEALKEGLKKAYEYQSHRDDSTNIRIKIDENKGTIKILKDLIVVSKVEDPE